MSGLGRELEGGDEWLSRQQDGGCRKESLSRSSDFFGLCDWCTPPEPVFCVLTAFMRC